MSTRPPGDLPDPGPDVRRPGGAWPTARRLFARSPMLLPGLYAWVATVATPAATRGAPFAARAAALAALFALVAGPFIALDRPRAGRLVGVGGFVGLSLVTWLIVSGPLSADRIDAVRAALGAIAWMLFAFGWGSVRELGHVPEDDPRVIQREPLEARSRLPVGAHVVLAVAAVGATIPLLLAWRVSRGDHALFAHATALACAIGTLHVGARVAVERGNWKPVSRARLRFSSARFAFFGLGLLVVVGGAAAIAN